MRVLTITLGFLFVVGCGADLPESGTPSTPKGAPQPQVRVAQDPDRPGPDAESDDPVAGDAPSPDLAAPRPEWEPEPYRHTGSLASDGDDPRFFTIAVAEKSRTRISLAPDRSSSRPECWYRLQIEDYFPETDSFFTQEALDSTLSWTPIDYSPRSGVDFFVLSEAHHGTTLIERWQLNASEETLVVVRPVANTPIGTPLRERQAAVEVEAKGEPRSEGEADRVLSLERSTIERRTKDNPHRDLVADPDGRYLVVLDTKAFRRIDLRDNSSTTLVALDELPEAAAKIDSLFFRHHADLGRLLFARTRGSGPEIDFRLVFIDRDNDGVFEERQQHDHASMMKLIGNPPAFVDDY